MLKTYIALLLGSLATPIFGATPLWQDIKESSITVSGARATLPQTYRTVRLDHSGMQQLLAQTPKEFTKAARDNSTVVPFPMPNGTTQSFKVQESPILSPEIAAQVPDLKTYSGQGIDDPSAVIRFSVSGTGLHAFILGADGSSYIDPYSSGNAIDYAVYRKRDFGAETGSFHCEIDRFVSEQGTTGTTTAARAPAGPGEPHALSNGTNLKTYRLAIATTGEYTVDRGGQDAAFQDVINAVNRINLVYRRDAAVAFTLVSGKNVVFPDPATDPYNNTDDAGQLAINQTTLDGMIGSANYDIGHLFGTGGGGIASSPSVCSSQKAEGYSARKPPTGDPFWVDYVAHEIGHQFSAQHTYNTLESGGCSTRSAQDAYEVASGVTIMSYVGICGDRNVQQNAIDDFHSRSLDQIIGELSSTTGGGTCGTTTAIANQPPVVNAGASFTIPKQTPFTLTAAGTDADGDALTYSWEEFDLAETASGPNGTPAGTYDVDTDGKLRPLFRAYAPSLSPSRTYPSLPYILNNANNPPQTYTGTSPTGAICENGITCVTGETLPSVTRAMKFRVVVRDNKGGVGDATTTINIDGNSGPFVITSPNTNTTVLGGSQLTVNWNVANTNAMPVNAANVKISLSTDSGQSFATVLADSAPNNGVATVSVPNISSTTARIKVEAVGNVFFDISDADFSITATASSPTPTPTATPIPTATPSPSATPTPSASPTPSATPTPSPSPSASPGSTPAAVGNISTRLPVGVDENVLITGFIVRGDSSLTKRVLVRAIGPSLANFGVKSPLADPQLTLNDGNRTVIAQNDNWRQTQLGGVITSDQVADIQASGKAPNDDRESALIATIPPGPYTAIVSGVGRTTGTGVAEAYDENVGNGTELANVSTRGFVDVDDNLMIAGFITVNQPLKVVVRGIGPSLSAFGIMNPLMDPTVDLRDKDGNLVASNDNWKTNDQTGQSQEADVRATNLQPTNDAESAIVQTLAPGLYTAQLRGKNRTTGVGIAEVYLAP